MQKINSEMLTSNRIYTEELEHVMDELRTCNELSSNDSYMRVIYDYKCKSRLEDEQTAYECLEEYQKNRIDPDSQIARIERLEKASKLFLQKAKQK